MSFQTCDRNFFLACGQLVHNRPLFQVKLEIFQVEDLKIFKFKLEIFGFQKISSLKFQV